MPATDNGFAPIAMLLIRPQQNKADDHDYSEYSFPHAGMYITNLKRGLKPTATVEDRLAMQM